MTFVCLCCRSEIRDGVQGTPVASNARITHLNCNSTVPFAVTWANNEIHVYETDTTFEPFMTYAPEGDLYDVNAVAFSTGYNSEGMWRFADHYREF